MSGKVRRPCWDAARLWIAADAAGIGLWSWNVDTDEIAMDDRAMPSGAGRGTARSPSPTCLPHRPARPRPGEDRVPGDPHDAGSLPDRLPHPLPGGIRWVSARGWGADEGIVGRIMFGVFLDSTARKEAEGARELLAGDTLGEHDMVLVYETPDDAVAARFSLMLNRLGAVRTKTMKAFPEGAYRQIVASLQ